MWKPLFYLNSLLWWSTALAIHGLLNAGTGIFACKPYSWPGFILLCYLFLRWESYCSLTVLSMLWDHLFDFDCILSESIEFDGILPEPLEFECILCRLDYSAPSQTTVIYLASSQLVYFLQSWHVQTTCTPIHVHMPLWPNESWFVQTQRKQMGPFLDLGPMSRNVTTMLCLHCFVLICKAGMPWPVVVCCVVRILCQAGICLACSVLKQTTCCYCILFEIG